MANNSKERRLTSVSQTTDLVRKRRKAMGLTQAALAAKLGMTQARVSALESGHSSLTLDRLIALANLLDLEVVLRNRQNRTAVEW